MNQHNNDIILNQYKFDEWLSKINKVSDPLQAIINAKNYLGSDVIIQPSDKPTKKYKIFDPNKKEYIYFGDIRYTDYTKHKDKIRQKNYLKRSSQIKGDWKENKYSPNNLSREILWK